MLTDFFSEILNLHCAWQDLPEALILNTAELVCLVMPPLCEVLFDNWKVFLQISHWFLFWSSKIARGGSGGKNTQLIYHNCGMQDSHQANFPKHGQSYFQTEGNRLLVGKNARGMIAGWARRASKKCDPGCLLCFPLAWAAMAIGNLLICSLYTSQWSCLTNTAWAQCIKECALPDWHQCVRNPLAISQQSAGVSNPSGYWPSCPADGFSWRVLLHVVTHSQ